MNHLHDKRKEDNQLSDQALPRCQTNRDYSTQRISQMVLKEILQKASQMQIRNTQVLHFIESYKLKYSQNFAINNCGEVLKNHYIQPEALTRSMTNQQNLGSSSKSPYSFLNYDQIDQENNRSNLSNKLQVCEETKHSSKIHNCNKIYIIKKRSVKIPSNDKNQSVQSIKINETSPSVTRRMSYRPDIYKISINNNSSMLPRRTSRTRFTANNAVSRPQNVTKRQLITSKTSIYPSSFINQNPNQKGEEDHNKIIRLENQKVKTSKKYDPEEKQVNQYISCLRERKQKLQNIMKVFDLDDQQKKTQKIERDNLLRQNKPQNIAETYNKAPSTTTDYDGNIVHIHESAIKSQGSQQNTQKKSFTRLPKYDSHDEGVLSHNVTFKVKEIDDKTKNFLNQIFSSAIGTPLKSNKKIGFNMKNLENSKNKKGQKTEKTQKNVSSKVSLSSDTKKEDLSKIQDDELATQSYEFTINKNLTNYLDQTKTMKSALKIPLKFLRNDTQNSAREKNKQNIEHENIFVNIFGNAKNPDLVSTRKKSIMRTDGSSKSYITNNKSSFKQLQTINREAYTSQKQRIHPYISRRKKSNIHSIEGLQRNKIDESSNEATEKNIPQNDHQPLKSFFEVLMTNM